MKLILLDRDGVINENFPASVQRPEDFHLLPGSAEALRLFNQAGYKTCIVTNQSIVGKGVITHEQLSAIHDRMQELLAHEGAYVDHLIYCPDVTVEPRYRRKPGPGMLLEAMAIFDANPADTVMIGDHVRDLEAAFTVHVTRFLVLTGHGAQMQYDPKLQDLAPVSIYKNLLTAAQALIGEFPTEK